MFAINCFLVFGPSILTHSCSTFPEIVFSSSKISAKSLSPFFIYIRRKPPFWAFLSR